jgi:hypothetical protein
MICLIVGPPPFENFFKLKYFPRQRGIRITPLFEVMEWLMFPYYN